MFLSLGVDADPVRHGGHCPEGPAGTTASLGVDGHVMQRGGEKITARIRRIYDGIFIEMWRSRDP